jgi:23S rRNA (cytosine1962-C5)-methyltransferase
MFPRDQYELLGFGNGRKLERFGPLIVDRPSPAAERMPRTDRALWTKADGRFERIANDQGQWKWRTAPPASWQIAHDPFSLHLKPTEFGHLGVFPEQAANWDWIAEKVRRAGRTLKVLNLFAYTGGSTLAAAAAGAEVTHVDAAKNVVQWARRNAKLSGLADAPIRWIAEDAVKFVRRELRRENFYDAVILDPPSYGHGPQGEAWKLASDLLPLLNDCAALVQRRPAFFLLTCHTPGFGPAELEAILSDTLFGACGQGVTSREMFLMTSGQQRLRAGYAARWPR